MRIKSTEQQEFIDMFDGVDPIRVFGFKPGEVPIYILFKHKDDRFSPRNLESYLLEFGTTPWQKFRAMYFGSRIFLGSFKKVGHVGYTDWFLFWCTDCRRFSVNYKQGFDQILRCLYHLNF